MNQGTLESKTQRSMYKITNKSATKEAFGQISLTSKANQASSKTSKKTKVPTMQADSSLANSPAPKYSKTITNDNTMILESDGVTGKESVGLSTAIKRSTINSSELKQQRQPVIKTNINQSVPSSQVAS